MMNVKTRFDRWLEEQGLSVCEAYSLAFVAESSARRVLTGKQSFLPTKHRLFMLTEISELKLTDNELREYSEVAGDSNKIEHWEQRIASRLIESWRMSGQRPSTEDTLVYSTRDYQNKPKLAQKLAKKFFNADISKLVKGQSSVRRAASDALNVEGLDRANTLDQNVQQVSDQLEAYLSQVGEEDLEAFIRRNNKALRKLTGNLVILMEENAYAALQQVKELKQKF